MNPMEMVFTGRRAQRAPSPAFLEMAVSDLRRNTAGAYCALPLGGQKKWSSCS
jgi:hypothetical protein